MISRISLTSLSDTVLQRSVPCFFDSMTQQIFQIDIPNEYLSNLPRISIKNEETIKTIPPVSGNYWIVTNEPILHCFHSAKRKLPLSGEYRVVYNGVTTNLQNRAREHLLRPDEKGGGGSQSGISVDLLSAPTNTSHIKCAWSSSTKRKLPKVFVNNEYVPITKKEDLLPILSDTEKPIWASNSDLFFKNGICVHDAKHALYEWMFVYIPISLPNVRDYVENAWRDAHGVPVLCSYLSGR